jgi:hypothetical protein
VCPWRYDRKPREVSGGYTVALKKSIMTILWRVQQAQMVISIVFWSLTLTGIFYPYISERVLDDLVGPENVALGMFLIFLVVVGLIILFGYAYDRLKFWKEQVTVIQERNPFSFGTRLTPIQITLFKAAISDDPVVKARALNLMEQNEKDPEVARILKEIDEEYGLG